MLGGELMKKIEETEKKPSKGKAIASFMLKTIFYFVVLLALIYLYEYSGIDSVHFIYNEF